MKTNKKVYIVKACHGIFEESFEEIIGIYSNKKRAEIAKIREDYFYKMLSEISDKEALRYFEEDEEFLKLWLNQQNIMTSYQKSIIVPLELK
jgi:hypothetical protein